MKTRIIFGMLLVLQTGISTAAVAAGKEVTVNQSTVQLTLTDFTQIQVTWGSRQVITGYEALIDVKEAQPGQALVVQASTETSGRWFAANFAMTTELSCSGVPLGISKAYGKRINNESTPARAEIREVRTPDQCTQLRVRLLKDGNLSRQFYTRIESANVALRLFAGSKS